MLHLRNTRKVRALKTKRLLVLILVLILTLCSCQTQETGEGESVDDKVDKIQIGMSFDSFVIERWIRDRDVFVSTANGLGADVNVQFIIISKKNEIRLSDNGFQ